MAMQITLLILMLATPVAYGVQHIVGGSTGWNQAGDYVTWAAGEKFVVGDTLLFTYDSSHKVDVVSQADYTACNSGNAINSYQDGNTTVALSTAGSMYFICPTAGHCSGGMKLAVTVTAANPPSTSPTTPSPPGTPPTTTTPSPPGTTTSPPPPPRSNGAASIYCNMMFGFSVVLGTMFAFMG
ncbi:uclacyanin-3-like [Corylus avellana]|uniref:uclacyanin-3-like n=1 Tax=Corylus avellana TaxID=13451 RepID=UPI00286C937A|nr:uclacyanin-3-like [Corylus avellana]